MYVYSCICLVRECVRFVCEPIEKVVYFPVPYLLDFPILTLNDS